MNFGRAVGTVVVVQIVAVVFIQKFVRQTRLIRVVRLNRGVRRVVGRSIHLRRHAPFWTGLRSVIVVKQIATTAAHAWAAIVRAAEVIAVGTLGVTMQPATMWATPVMVPMPNTVMPIPMMPVAQAATATMTMMPVMTVVAAGARGVEIMQPAQAVLVAVAFAAAVSVVAENDLVDRPPAALPKELGAGVMANGRQCNADEYRD